MKFRIVLFLNGLGKEVYVPQYKNWYNFTYHNFKNYYIDSNEPVRFKCIDSAKKYMDEKIIDIQFEEKCRIDRESRKKYKFIRVILYGVK